MLRIFHFLFILNIFCNSFLYAQEGDFTIDPKTSKAMPNFIGEILKMRGKASIVNMTNSKTITVKVGTKIFKKAKLITGNRSFVKIRMVDDSVLDIAPNSSMVFEDYKFTSKNQRSGTFSLLKGKIRSLIKKKLEGDHKIIYKTPTASMGIRGTEFLANVIDGPNASKTSNTQILVLSGNVNVNGEGPLKAMNTISLTPGNVLETYNLNPDLDNKNKLVALNDIEIDYYKKLDQDPLIGFKPFLEFDSYGKLNTKAVPSKVTPNKNKFYSSNLSQNSAKNLTAQKIRKADKISRRQLKKIGSKKSQFSSVMYFDKMYGSVHEVANINSYSLTTIGCGHPVRVYKDNDGFSQEFLKVKIAQYKGYVLKAHLSLKRPECFSKKYSRFTNTIDLDLSDLFYWGRIYDQFRMGKTPLYK
jgi:hypothetical protein